jgi:hypothetical protein
MADTFYAVTRIKAGERQEDGSQDGKYVPHTFEPGDEIKGLSKEVMTQLWNAGALTRTKPEEDEAEPSDEGPEASDSKPAAAKASASKAAPGRSQS